MASTAAAVKGMDITPGGMAELRQKTCGPCIEGKMTRAPFPSSESRTTAPLQFLHTEVCGPMRVVSSGGNAYFVTIIDNETKYKAFTPIRTKGKAKQAVIATVNRWETLTGLKVKVIRSNNGKEYEGTDFERWLSDKGIQHETSVPYTPQQNRVAERYNRVISERTMALLADSGLPPKWRAEAGSYRELPGQPCAPAQPASYPLRATPWSEAGRWPHLHLWLRGVGVHTPRYPH